MITRKSIDEKLLKLEKILLTHPKVTTFVTPNYKIAHNGISEKRLYIDNQPILSCTLDRKIWFVENFNNILEAMIRRYDENSAKVKKLWELLENHESLAN